MAASNSPREVRSEARGPHWVAWIPDASGKPSGSVVLVGKTREEALRAMLASAGQERLITVDEVATAVLELCDPKGERPNGAAVTISGD